MSYLVIVLLILPALTLAGELPFRATAVKATLVCGTHPYEGAHAYLFRMNTEDQSQILDSRITSDSGMIHLEGTTNGRPENETTLMPIVRIFHRCDVTDKNENLYRRWQFQIPSEYVNNGRHALKTYDAGTLNLQMKYPKEKKVTFQP